MFATPKGDDSTLELSWIRTPYVPPCPTDFCATLGDPPANVDLTTDGSIDWIHWGDPTGSGFVDPDRKVGVDPSAGPIGTLMTVGTGFTVAEYNNNPNTCVLCRRNAAR